MHFTALMRHVILVFLLTLGCGDVIPGEQIPVPGFTPPPSCSLPCPRVAPLVILPCGEPSACGIESAICVAGSPDGTSTLLAECIVHSARNWWTCVETCQ